MLLLKKLELSNFRNLKNVDIDFENQVSVFLGNNGQGKTNFVESLYFLSKGKSFRTSKIEHLIANDSESALAKLYFNLNNLNYEAVAVLEKKSKKLILNGKNTSPIKILKKLPLIFFSPESLLAIKEGPELRRGLLDETTVLENEENLNTHSNFRKILKTRNKIIKDFVLGNISKLELNKILDSVDPQFAKLSVEVTQLRKKIIKTLNPYITGLMNEITNDPNVNICVEHHTQETLEHLDYENELKTLNNTRHQDCKYGYTQNGPHKHEITFLYNGKDSRFFSSQGQQRALILAFKFAQIMYHKEVYKFSPILILDDVLSELDREKRNYLLKFLKRSEVQTFLTTSELSDSLSGISAQTFFVENGVVRRK